MSRAIDLKTHRTIKENNKTFAGLVCNCLYNISKGDLEMKKLIALLPIVLLFVVMGCFAPQKQTIDYSKYSGTYLYIEDDMFHGGWRNTKRSIDYIELKPDGKAYEHSLNSGFETGSLLGSYKVSGDTITITLKVFYNPHKIRATRKYEGRIKGDTVLIYYENGDKYNSPQYFIR